MSDLLIRRRNLLIRKQEEELNIRAVCFKADGEQTVAITKVGSAPTITMQYSYDGMNWDAWDLTPLPFGGSTKVYVRGVNNTKFGSGIRNYQYFTFGTEAYVYVSGIVESLLDGENEVTTLTAGYVFINLFVGQGALRSAKDLKFEMADNLNGGAGVYMSMFQNCSNLLYAPLELPAKSLGSDSCYQEMFRGCTRLLTAPVLPATTLSNQCYRHMFNNCKSLVNAHELPATTLTNNCYYFMFFGCTSLVNAPKLPATELAASCYYNMFYGCTSLKTIRCHAKVTANNATVNWLNGVKTSGIFYGYSEYGWSSGVSGIPTTWTFEELTD